MSIIMDIGTTKSMRHSFLGVIVYYVEEVTCVGTTEALGLINFEGGKTHSGEYIMVKLEDLLKLYGLKLEDINFIVTDGASNMKKALK